MENNRNQTRDQAIVADMRLLVLQELYRIDGYTMNDVVMSESLKAKGHVYGRAVLCGQIDWLGDNKLVTVSQFGLDIRVATLTELGAEVAQGVSRCDGVRRPLPGHI